MAPPQVSEGSGPKGIGVRLVDGFSKQLGATFERRRTDSGSEIALSFFCRKMRCDLPPALSSKLTLTFTRATIVRRTKI